MRKEKMFYYLCKEDTNEIIAVFKQHKRASDAMDKNTNTFIQGLSPNFYQVENLHIGSTLPAVLSTISRKNPL